MGFSLANCDLSVWNGVPKVMTEQVGDGRCWDRLSWVVSLSAARPPNSSTSQLIARCFIASVSARITTAGIFSRYHLTVCPPPVRRSTLFHSLRIFAGYSASSRIYFRQLWWSRLIKILVTSIRNVWWSVNARLERLNTGAELGIRFGSGRREVVLPLARTDVRGGGISSRIGVSWW